jgi:hypothetical protein
MRTHALTLVLSYIYGFVALLDNTQSSFSRITISTCCVCRRESARWRDGSGGEVQEWDEDPSGDSVMCRNVLVLLERRIKGAEVLSCCTGVEGLALWMLC